MSKKTLLNKIANKLLSVQTAYAHCDIPCGIYTTEPAKTAAQTVVKMVQKLQELEYPNYSDSQAVLTFLNTTTRAITAKEEHAQKCKEELLILWTDYFKKEHLEEFPDLHNIVWQATKLCSQNKKEVNLETAQELQKKVNEIADIFEKSNKDL